MARTGYNELAVLNNIIMVYPDVACWDNEGVIDAAYNTNSGMVPQAIKNMMDTVTGGTTNSGGNAGGNAGGDAGGNAGGDAGGNTGGDAGESDGGRPPRPDDWVPPPRPDDWVAPERPDDWVAPERPDGWVPPERPDGSAGGPPPRP